MGEKNDIIGEISPIISIFKTLVTFDMGLEASKLSNPTMGSLRETHLPTMGATDTPNVPLLNPCGLNSDGLQVQRRGDIREGGQTGRLTGLRHI